MKIEEKINVKKIIAQSKKNQKKLDSLFDNLKGEDLSEKEQQALLAELADFENLALSIKNKFAK